MSRRRSQFIAITQASVGSERLEQRWTAHTSLHYALSGLNLVDVSHADIGRPRAIRMRTANFFTSITDTDAKGKKK